MKEINGYLKKHQLVPSRITESPSPDLGLVVVIPCYAEPDLHGVLDALWRCARPTDGAVEVIVVVNAPSGAEPDILARNRRTLVQAREWIVNHGMDPRLRYHLLDFPALPRRHAGVGLARKLGMDEAVARFHAVDNAQGVIASLDADCGCDPNYLEALVEHFRIHPKAPACTVYFEHPLDSADGFEARAGIAGYELFLRYYVAGLRYAGSPWAHHTVGSAMAVRCAAYERQGGMNRRKAGEDFHFLRKFMMLDGFGNLCRTCVLPSPRISTRVPFGTGRAMAGLLERRRTYTVYGPEVFRDLRVLLSRVPAFRDLPEDGGGGIGDRAAKGLPDYVRAFLSEQAFPERLAEIRRNAATERSFIRRFHRWFDALMTLHFVHFATDEHYPKIPVEQGAAIMLAWSEGESGWRSGVTGRDREALLRRYRERDRQCGCP